MKVDVSVYNRSLEKVIDIINVDEHEASLARVAVGREQTVTLSNSVDTYVFSPEHLGAIRIQKRI